MSGAHLAHMIGIAATLRIGSPTRQASPYVELGDLTPGYTDDNVHIFARLAFSNAANLRYLYGDRAPGPVNQYVLPPTVRLDTLDQVVAAIKVFKCYRYQSSDQPGWADSSTGIWVERVIDALVFAIPGYRRAYDAAPWGISDREVSAAK